MAQQDSTRQAPPAAIVNTPLWRAMGASREHAAALQDAILAELHCRRLPSWREVVTKAAEEVLSEVHTPSGMDEASAFIEAFDSAAVAGFALAVTAPCTPEEVGTWFTRARALVDFPNWAYRNMVVSGEQRPVPLIRRLRLALISLLERGV